MSSIAAAAPSALSGKCTVCSRERGAGIACQFCGHVEGLEATVHLASPGKRFGGYLLDGLLVIFTLFIGWLIWSLIVWARGQTPAKQLLGMRVVKIRSGTRGSWGTMFLREIIAKSIVGFLGAFTLGIIYFWLIWDKSNQELWDKIVGTIVVNDRGKTL